MTANGASTLIRGARVFNGQRLHQAGDVLLAGGTIAGVGPALGIPAGAGVIDGRGRTLLPGLIDCHVHAGDVRALSQALAFGVTTELDMFIGPGLAAERRSLAARRDDVADIRTATLGATLPGSQFGRLAPGLPAVAGPEDAAAFVAARATKGADPAWQASASWLESRSARARSVGGDRRTPGQVAGQADRACRAGVPAVAGAARTSWCRPRPSASWPMPATPVPPHAMSISPPAAAHRASGPSGRRPASAAAAAWKEATGQADPGGNWPRIAH